MRNAKTVLGLVVLGLASTAASGQSLESLIKSGDTVLGLGAMNNVTFLAVNDSKTWSALMSTTFDDSTRDGCILSNGFVTLREGTALLAPPGAVLDEWNSVSVTNSGDLGMLIRVKPVTGLSFDGIYWNLVPVAKKDQTLPFPPFPVTGVLADWDTFSVVKLNTKNQLFVMGEVANPLVTRNKERSLIRYQLDDAGSITGTTVLATEGMLVPAGLRLLGQQCMLNNEHILAVNNRGDVITLIAQDAVQWLVINMETAVAKKGTPSPVGGLWRDFSQSRVAINDRGDWVISGAVEDPVGYLIVKNGQKFVQQGEVFPAISPLPLGNGSLAPLYIANNGDVFWHGRIGASDSFMRNKDAIVISGQTIVGNRLVTSILGGENGFSISPNGRFWVGLAQLQSIGTAALFSDFGLVLEVPGCHGNQGKLSLASGKALLGNDIQLAMDRGQAAGAVTAVYFSRQSVLSPNGCGIRVKGGELMLGPPLLGHRTLAAWNGVNPSVGTFRIANQISLLDAVFFAQGVFFKPGHPTEEVRLTNALRIEIGAP